MRGARSVEQEWPHGEHGSAIIEPLSGAVARHVLEPMNEEGAAAVRRELLVVGPGRRRDRLRGARTAFFDTATKIAAVTGDGHRRSVVVVIAGVRRKVHVAAARHVVVDEGGHTIAN